MFVNPFSSFNFRAIAVCVGLSLVAILSVVSVMLLNKNRDLESALARQTAITSTVSERMERIGVVMKAQGEVLATMKEAEKLAQQTLGQQLADYMAKNDAQIRSIYTAVGRISQTTDIGYTGPVAPGPNGAFKGVNLLQGRPGPATTEVKLDYDPMASDPTKRLTATWTNYREDFFPSLGEWKKRDGGYVAAFRLRREIWRGADKVGEEEIPLTEAKATYGPNAFPAPTPAVPRWSLLAGVGHDFDSKKTVPVGIIGYRLTNTIGLHTGAVGSTFLIGGSWQFDLK